MTVAEDPGRVIRRHSRSFSTAARLLAPGPRRRAERLYAWCRSADDAVDLSPGPAAASAALESLRDGLDDAYGRRPTGDTAVEALRMVVEDCALPREYPEALLTGLAMDVAGNCYETIDELLIYCHRVAGVVGLMMCHALGISDDLALPHAAYLGIAMQLTNIARDVAEDWSRGRLYLPRRWLRRIPATGDPPDDASFEPAIRKILAVADRYYASGDQGLRYLAPRSRVAVRVARAAYSAIGARVARAAGRCSSGRVAVPRWRFCGVVLAAAAAGAAWRPVPCHVRPPSTVWEFRPLA